MTVIKIPPKKYDDTCKILDVKSQVVIHNKCLSHDFARIIDISIYKMSITGQRAVYKSLNINSIVLKVDSLDKKNKIQICLLLTHARNTFSQCSA